MTVFSWGGGEITNWWSLPSTRPEKEHQVLLFCFAVAGFLVWVDNQRLGTGCVTVLIFF